MNFMYASSVSTVTDDTFAGFVAHVNTTPEAQLDHQASNARKHEHISGKDQVLF